MLAAQEAAQSANRAKGEFLANMSHEIRTPLTAVLGFAGLLAKMDELPARARSHVQRIVDGGKTLHTLVDDILDFSRIESGRLEMRLEAVDLRRFLSDVVALVGPDAEKSNWRFSSRRRATCLNTCSQTANGYVRLC